ncbi:MAG: hypothetical protein VZS44_11150 [Bacilli bacterium]|nr:hypothetical protein [Bacilli bacterium]
MMKKKYELTEQEYKELESLNDILIDIHDCISEFLELDMEGHIEEDEEMANLSYEEKYKDAQRFIGGRLNNIWRSHNVLSNILYGNKLTDTLTDFELSK